MIRNFFASSFRKIAYVITGFLLIAILQGCSSYKTLSDGRQQDFLSLTYNHFENGVHFTDIESGLTILWKASFQGRMPYKENIGLILRDGLLILPNRENTETSARIPFHLKVNNRNLFVFHSGEYKLVQGIIHTHIGSIPEPAPMADYQFGYLGLHNYIISYNDIFDAFKDRFGYEVYKRIGGKDYTCISQKYDVFPRFVTAQN